MHTRAHTPTRTHPHPPTQTCTHTIAHTHTLNRALNESHSLMNESNHSHTCVMIHSCVRYDSSMCATAGSWVGVNLSFSSTLRLSQCMAYIVRTYVWPDSSVRATTCHVCDCRLFDTIQGTFPHLSVNDLLDDIPSSHVCATWLVCTCDDMHDMSATLGPSARINAPFGITVLTMQIMTVNDANHDIPDPHERAT